MLLAIKYYFRYLLKNKTVSLVGFLGLTIAIAAALVIFVYCKFEWSYDKYNQHYDQIYRLRLETCHNGKVEYSGYNVNPPSGLTLKKTFPEVVDFTRMFAFQEAVFSYNNRFFDLENIFFADSTVFNVFTFHFLKGDQHTALVAPRSVIITQTTANKIFGTDDPIGKLIKYGKDAAYQVTGVIEDIPENSHLRINMLASYASMENNAFRYQENRWDRYWVYTYLLVKEGTNKEQLEKKINVLFNEYKPASVVSSWTHTLQPMCDFHLYSKNDKFAITGNGDIVKLIFVIGVLILLIAYINQTNISVSQALERIKTVALSHVIGGKTRKSTIGEFVVESVGITLVCFVLAIGLSSLLSPLFSHIFHFHFTLLIISFSQWLIGIAGLLAIAVIAGIYPAIVVLSQNLNESLKSKIKYAGVGLFFRKGLIVLQYSITCCLIIGALVIYKQKDYMLNKNLGLDITNTIVIKGASLSAGNNESKARIEVFRNELMSDPKFLDITSSNALPGNNNYGDGTYSDVQQVSDIVIHMYYHVDYDFISSFNIQVIAGRGFSRDFPSDEQSGSIINKKAVRTLGFNTPEEAIGHTITREYDQRKTTIIGVVNDFHLGALSSEIPPVVMMLYPDEKRFYSVKYSGLETQAAIKKIEKTWTEIFPDEKLSYFILEDNYKNLYKGVENYGVILSIFSGLAIFLSCFGLFGLSFYTIGQRTKEIGIRKINGASIFSVSQLLCASFTKIIILAFVVACPVAYYLSIKWIEGFAYKTILSWWVFALSGIISLSIALFTVSWQSWKAAIRNPIEALRYE
jgi:putative ABC transport system permease protein